MYIRMRAGKSRFRNSRETVEHQHFSIPGKFRRESQIRNIFLSAKIAGNKIEKKLPLVLFYFIWQIFRSIFLLSL